ncbi:MAG: transposase [Phycisphaeraceae bacterium]|nr:transposase [Phycisphaeraceae bacterium]
MVLSARPPAWRWGACGAGYVRESAALYRPRHPERSAFYRLLDAHFAEFESVHEERFEPEDGPLRTTATKVVGSFLDCGRPENGFARVRCPECGGEFFVAFSCQTRNFCPSCQQKRAELLAEKLREDVLAPVAHRHAIFTVPKALRRLFLRERRLLGILPRCAAEAITRCWRAALDRKDGVPGIVASIQTFGSQVNWHPHVHALVTEGLLLPGGTVVPGPAYDEPFERLLTETFRRLVLQALHREERISDSFLESLLTWRHGGGFSVYARHLILNEEPARLAHMSRYLVRPVVAGDRVHETADGRVLLDIPPDPKTGATALVLDPLEWIRRITNQIPEPRSHLVRYYGAYANRCRARFRAEEGKAGIREDASEAPEGRKSRASWARLLRRVFEVELTCPACGVDLTVVSVITEPETIDRILAHVRDEDVDLLFDARAPPAA